jgi:hypothetical protein
MQCLGQPVLEDVLDSRRARSAEESPADVSTRCLMRSVEKNSGKDKASDNASFKIGYSRGNGLTEATIDIQLAMLAKRRTFPEPMTSRWRRQSIIYCIPGASLVTVIQATRHHSSLLSFREICRSSCVTRISISL